MAAFLQICGNPREKNSNTMAPQQVLPGGKRRFDGVVANQANLPCESCRLGLYRA